MSQITLANLRRYTQDNGGGAAAELTEFVAAYFESADPDELQARSAEQLLAIAQAHLRLYERPSLRWRADSCF
jgi:two-component sensor histidine kinase